MIIKIRINLINIQIKNIIKIFFKQKNMNFKIFNNLKMINFKLLQIPELYNNKENSLLYKTQKIQI